MRCTPRTGTAAVVCLAMVWLGGSCRLLEQEGHCTWVQHAQDAPRYSILEGDGVATLMVNEESCGSTAVSFGLLELEVGAAVPQHVHTHSTELIYTIEGSGVLTLDGVEHLVVPGVVVSVPAGIPHAFVVTSQHNWRGTQVYTPAGPEAQFRSASRAAR